MAKITIKPQALSQFDEIVKSVIEFTGFETSGIRLQSDIFDKIEQIAFMPLSGRVREDGTRETFVRRYRIVYDYDRQADEVIILAIIHSSRLYPRP
ncbi:type II toxin-antitoxin system RelE/ParE family toxin [Mannheimia pernigra]|uniref:type II toxin-antitoxin system RelE/ParE family toxin n=1 Tax=Mannheimia pernigra TaxID=111844 RepID=UPI0013173C6F|nr:type II toxin-antitoxin system RelE/ParE family toxin [Mannheimia pernigra]QHB17871.1 type II toxin-antitoxin system RelE/ParE family toxin [Mannheimia pernigra]